MQTLKKFYFGKSKFKPFISTWKTDNLSSDSSTATQVKLPLVSTGSYNFVVEWGDGTQSTITAWNQAQATKTYTVAGTYQITIKGKCIGWVFNNNDDRLKILSVSKWGSLKLGTNQGSYFYGCANLNLVAVEDKLDLKGVTNLSLCFRGCTTLTTINKVSEWDTSGVVNIGSMFSKSYNVNDNIGSWDVSNATIGSMFECAFTTRGKFNNGGSPSINNWVLKTSGNNLVGMFINTEFNQPVGSWNIIGCTSLDGTFQSCNLFNQDIGGWNVSNITSFNNSFQTASSFNNGGSPSINNWVLKTSGPVVFSTMFQNAIAFNQPINNWDISAATNMNSMFQSASSFNNGLSSGVAGNMFWNTSSVTSMTSMFSGATSFNQNLGVLNLPNCSSFNSMFSGASKFNNGGSNDISSWVLKTTGTIDMTSMFASASIFNKPLAGWNTSRVISMTSMFASAYSFNQNIGSWNVSNVTSFAQFMNTKTAANFSAANLDAIYNGWSTRPVKTPITITFGTAKHTSAGAAGRAILTGAPNNWTIVDGGI